MTNESREQKLLNPDTLAKEVDEFYCGLDPVEAEVDESEILDPESLAHDIERSRHRGSKSLEDTIDLSFTE